MPKIVFKDKDNNNVVKEIPITEITLKEIKQMPKQLKTLNMNNFFTSEFIEDKFCYDCKENLTQNKKPYRKIKGFILCLFCGCQYNTKGYSKTRGKLK